MGLFADKIETVVSSSVWNLAGDESLHQDHLKSAIISNVLYGNDNLAQSISNTYTQGSVISQKRFLKFMTDQHPTYLIDGAVNSYTDVNAQAIQTPVSQLLGLTAGQTLRIAAAKIDVGEIDYWAENWIQQTNPTLGRADWFAEYDDSTDEIVITAPGPIKYRLAAPTDLLWATEAHAGTEARKLLYVSYSIIEPGDETVQATESLQDMFVYRMGSGNVALDGLISASTPMTEFYPALPLRLRNKSIRHADYTTEYGVTKDGYRKLTRQKVDPLLDAIEDNPDIDDIDYAFLVHGVPLNTTNQVAKEYIYKFMSQLKDTQTQTRVDYDSYFDRVVEAERARLEWERYLSRQEAGDVFWGEEPPAEPQEVASEPPRNTFEIAAPALENLRQRLSWCFMEETLQSGNCQRFDGDATRTKAKQGEYFIHAASPYEFKTRWWRQSQGDDGNEGRFEWKTVDLPRIFLMYQVNPFAYTRLEIVGFLHENFVYKQEAVEIKAEDALENVDPSGFLIPLHAPTYADMGMAKATRMASSTSHIVFNSYERVRQKWYENSFFRVILVAALAALSVVVPGLGGMAASGILGSNLAVGVSLGMTTALSAAIAGAVANALAAVVVVTIIDKGSQSIFGEKVGAVIGAIASFVALNAASTIASGGTFDWGRFMSADNLLRLTDAVGNAYVRYLGADTAEIYAEMTGLEDEYENEFQEIEDLVGSVLGSTGVELDPLQLGNVMNEFTESSEVFLSRTLLTGTDVVRISHNMISDFTDVSLTLPKAIV